MKRTVKGCRTGYTLNGLKDDIQKRGREKRSWRHWSDGRIPGNSGGQFKRESVISVRECREGQLGQAELVAPHLSLN